MTEEQESSTGGGEEAHAIEVECGANKATLRLERVQMGSKGACVLFDAAWITPNEFQFVSGRETAKDWKRSIKHGGKSLKILLARHLVSFRPPFCICEGCSPGGSGAAPPPPPTATTTGDRPSNVEEKPANDRPEPSKKRKRKSDSKHSDRKRAKAVAILSNGAEKGTETKSEETPANNDENSHVDTEEAPVAATEAVKIEEPVEEKLKEVEKREIEPSEKNEEEIIEEKHTPSDDDESPINAENAAAPISCAEETEAPHLQSPKISQSSPPEGSKGSLPHPFASVPAPTPFAWYYYAPYGMMPFTPYAPPPSLPYPSLPSSIPSSMSSPFSSVSSPDVSSTMTEKRELSEKPLDLSQRKEVMTRPAHPMPLIPSPITPRSPWMPSFYASPSPSSNPHLEAVLTWSAEDVVRFVSSIDHCAKYAKKFRDVGVTGSSLPYLSVEHLMMLIQMQAPEACSLRAAIDRLLFLPATSLFVPL